MISVILSTKNGSKHIMRAIESVRSQTEKNFELIVVNDGSTDDTKEIVEKFCSFDSRIRIINLEKNVGPGVARDIGIKAASTSGKESYIALIDDDDIWMEKRKLERQKAFLDTHHDHVLVGAAKIFNIDELGRPYPNKYRSAYLSPRFDHDIRNQFLLRNCFITSSVMFRKRTYEAVGGFKPMYLAEEYDLWLRMGKVGKIANIDGIEVSYMVRPDSISKVRRQEMCESILNIVKEYKDEYPYAFLGLAKAYARLLFFHLKKIF